jgi:hypothetical protein
MMQVPEMFRRGVVVPMDEDAEHEMRSWNVSAAVHVRFLPIENEASFNSIWEAGVFAELNHACGTNMDDYEEEVMEPKALDRAIAVIARRSKESCPLGLQEFMTRLLGLLREAKEMNRPVFFVL